MCSTSTTTETEFSEAPEVLLEDIPTDERLEHACMQVTAMTIEAQAQLDAPVVAPKDLTSAEESENLEAEVWKWKYDRSTRVVNQMMIQNQKLYNEIINDIDDKTAPNDACSQDDTDTSTTASTTSNLRKEVVEDVRKWVSNRKQRAQKSVSHKASAAYTTVGATKNAVAVLIFERISGLVRHLSTVVRKPHPAIADRHDRPERRSTTDVADNKPFETLASWDVELSWGGNASR